jgi:hypothetical protein
MFEIGRAAALFADDNEVQKRLRDFYGAAESLTQRQREMTARQQAGTPSPQDAGQLQVLSESATSLLVNVIRELSRGANFPVQYLSDSEVRKIFTLNLSNPSGFSTVILNTQQQPATAPPQPPR